MLKNAECGAIIQVIGAGSGRTFDIDAARYGKIVLLVDADVDGAHIRILLLTLFQRYMRPMVEAGRVFAAVPPLHRIELVQPKKGQDKYVYTYSDNELRTRCWSSSARASATRTPSSATRASVRWTPTSWRRPRWTRVTAPCGGSTSVTSKPPSRSSTC